MNVRNSSLLAGTTSLAYSGERSSLSGGGFNARMQIWQQGRGGSILASGPNKAATMQEKKQEFVENLPFFSDCSFGLKRYVALRMVPREFKLQSLDALEKSAPMENAHFDPVVIRSGEISEETDCIFMI